MISISGFLTAQITGADIARTLELLTLSDITLLSLVPESELCVTVTIFRRDFVKFKEICDKRGDFMRVTKRGGAYWNVKGLMKRPVLVLGLICILFGALYLPSRIFFVRVEGNSAIPTRLILEMADRCGIGFGASRRAVRSERMKNALLESVPGLQWAGVNTYGCVAVISVRERTEQGSTPAESEFGHIVALMDCILTDCTATRGNLLCRPGQAVTAGEILISGYTDTGLCIRAEQAQGEVYGQTIRKLTAMMPTNWLTVSETGEERKKISLLIGKKRINLWKDSGIWDTTCDRMYEEYYITLPGGFQLPVALTVERYSLRNVTLAEIPQTEAEMILADRAEGYLDSCMLAGTIRDSELEYTQQPGLLRMAGEYDCTELIGVMQRLEMGE